MDLSSLTPISFTFLKIFCYFILAFYLIRVLKFIIWGKSNKDPHRLREALSMVYTIFASYFIFISIDSIIPFVQNIVERLNHLISTPAIIITINILSGFVCAAFICNFSRSLWMLKTLDHSIFDPVPDWKTLSANKYKRWFEFITRTIAAVLFILLEEKLKDISLSTHLNELKSLSVSPFLQNNMSDAGKLGLLLYLALGLWWLSGWVIAKNKMPKVLLLFYVTGLINSGFIYLYGGNEISEALAELLILIIVLVSAAAIYMLGFVLKEVVQTVHEFLLKYWSNFVLFHHRA